MVDYAKTLAWRSGDVRHAHTAKDTILYALGAGGGSNPQDERQLRLVYEKDLVALPTMATVLASPGAWMRDHAELGINFGKMVHGEQSVQIHTPLPASGSLVGRSRVARLVDKGEGKGAIMHVEKELWDEAADTLVATCEQVLFLRGDGGFARAGGGDEPAAAPEPVPGRSPDQIVTMPTRPDQAALYRLSGDLNPLHIDPDFASKAGFPRPILHGLATYGFACRGLIESFCDGDPRALTAIRARMSAPVFPGDTIRLECWRLGRRIAFQARVVERDALVLSHGWAAI
ncbi:MaoC/PaaZ C-terminal domain-containing protein [Rhodopseudomonas palustris]|uniref:MaoC/PaaZ C-terminal domain-containing protein n=1 Tax=Rhodopseudomonas palustris TaxID=1076 RepID=UPI002ACE232F|nr:MaoC/PaaZ C-terminal domain-containing protein [Rhodopseudomonas palustris]WQH00522.1 MaoC/PaaZ C-terminal domain-containing protein [Rhodopseudomonas palustris]